jgi:hypothetical protein
MSHAKQLAHFETHGWMIVDLPDTAAVAAVRDRLLQHLRRTSLPDLDRLESYHTHVRDDRHTEILFDLAQFYWREQLGTPLIASHLDFFKAFIGPDLAVQKYPYLRAVRPGTDQDAVFLHRDTYYGSSPYEIAVFIPFVDLPSDSALRVVSGSHVEADASYPWTSASGGGVTPGSPKHQLGFPYAPKKLEAAIVERAEPVPLAFGQAMLFSLSLVHGGGTNAGDVTRFSTDIRVVNAFAPIEWSHSVHLDYYLPLSDSLVTRTAKRYFAANGQA